MEQVLTGIAIIATVSCCAGAYIVHRVLQHKEIMSGKRMPHCYGCGRCHKEGEHENQQA